MTNIVRVWEHFLKKNIFWNLDLSSNTQSNGDLWFKCELFIVFVTFQNLNLCWDKANSGLHLNNNGAHSSFWFTYSSSNGSSILCWRLWAVVLGRHGYWNLRLLLHPDVPSWMYAWWLGCIYTTWNGSDPDLQLKMWLTTPNGEHFITLVLWIVSEGLWFSKWTTAAKDKVCSHEAVALSQQIMYVQSQDARQTIYYSCQGHLTPSACTRLRLLTKHS